MAINLTDEIIAKTKKGKIASAKQVFLEGDTENLQQIGDTTHQLEEAIRDISTTGGASTANAVSYNNKASGMAAVTAQAAIDELAEKNKAQDSTIATKANAADVTSKMQAEQARVNAELDNKFRKADIAQKLGDAGDKVVSQSALPFREIDSPEFLYCLVDADDHLLLGIQLDGSIEWEAGIPSPVRAKLQNIADKLQQIVTQSQQDKADLTTSINTAKAELSASLQQYMTITAASLSDIQHSKVDKEDGKSLIDDEVKECFNVIENDEFIHAITDSDDRLLFGIYRATGKPYLPLNDMYHVEQDKEFFALWLDDDGKIILGIRRDGKIIGEIQAVNALKLVIAQIQSDIDSLQEKISSVETNVTANKNGIASLQSSLNTVTANLQAFLNIFSLQDNPEYLAIETDADGKVLSATDTDGSHYAYNMKSETIDAKVDKETNKSLIDSDVAKAHSTIDDKEGRTEITTDADNKILSFRGADGVKHEHNMEVTNLNVSNLNLQGNSVNHIQDALKANGFDVKTPVDWSESGFIQIPEPRFAIINITNIDSMPTTKTQNKKAFLEFWDMQGNYFKKHAILNAQGNSSMGFVKKNVAIDLCDDEWVGDDTPNVRIGNWVSQDSFHMKAYYTDFFRGVGAVSYKLYDQIVRTRGNMYDRPWKKALLDMSKIDVTTKSLGNPYIGDYSLLTDTGARCFPDGFPVAVYFKGEFYGIFSFQLKKHRDNYHLDKGTAEHVHLDGTINYNILWNGTIVWGTGDNGFEVRNPKNLYAIGGNKYDADIKQEEIAGQTEVDAWIAAGKLPDGTDISSKIKKNLQMTAQVKKYIQDFANTVNTIKTAASTYEASSKSEDDLKAFKQVFEKYYDAENLIDYMIVSDLIKNSDGFNKNWQWFTYDGIKWWVGLYDCDMSFGGHFQGNQITNVLTNHLNASTNMPNGYIVKYYAAELNARYKYLADKGIASADNIFSLLQDWCMRIGTDFFKEEYKKWADSPCIADSVIRSDYWEALLNEDGTPQTDTSETFYASQAYNVDDVVSFGLNAQMGYFKYKCIKATTALTANTPHTVSAYSPVKTFKHCDSIYRVQKWIEQNTANMDEAYNYTRNN